MESHDKKICRQCACSRIRKECSEFQKIVDLSDAGVVIYRHSTRVEDAIYLASDFKINVTNNDVFIIHNKNNAEVTSADIVPALVQNKVDCPRCQFLMDHARRLLQKVSIVDKQDVIGICDHCKIKGIYRRCIDCTKIVKKFMTSVHIRGDYEETKERLKTWLNKIQTMLKDISSGDEKGLKVKSLSQSDLHIDKLGQYSKRAVYVPDVEQMFIPEKYRPTSSNVAPGYFEPRDEMSFIDTESTKVDKHHAPKTKELELSSDQQIILDKKKMVMIELDPITQRVDVKAELPKDLSAEISKIKAIKSEKTIKGVLIKPKASESRLRDRKYHSEDDLTTYIADVTKQDPNITNKGFEYVFPKEARAKLAKGNLTSSLLIKDMQDRLKDQAEKKQIEISKRKSEETEKKTIAIKEKRAKIDEQKAKLVEASDSDSKKVKADGKKEISKKPEVGREAEVRRPPKTEDSRLPLESKGKLKTKSQSRELPKDITLQERISKKEPKTEKVDGIQSSTMEKQKSPDKRSDDKQHAKPKDATGSKKQDLPVKDRVQSSTLEKQKRADKRSDDKQHAKTIDATGSKKQDLPAKDRVQSSTLEKQKRADKRTDDKQHAKPKDATGSKKEDSPLKDKDSKKEEKSERKGEKSDQLSKAKEGIQKDKTAMDLLKKALESQQTKTKDIKEKPQQEKELKETESKIKKEEENVPKSLKDMQEERKKEKENKGKQDKEKQDKEKQDKDKLSDDKQNAIPSKKQDTSLKDKDSNIKDKKKAKENDEELKKIAKSLQEDIKKEKEDIGKQDKGKQGKDKNSSIKDKEQVKEKDSNIKDKEQAKEKDSNIKDKEQAKEKDSNRKDKEQAKEKDEELKKKKDQEEAEKKARDTGYVPPVTVFRTESEESAFNKTVLMKDIKIRKPSCDDINLRLVKIKKSARKNKALGLPMSLADYIRHKGHFRDNSNCDFCLDSDLELELNSYFMRKEIGEQPGFSEMILRDKIIKKTHKPPMKKEENIVPVLFMSAFDALTDKMRPETVPQVNFEEVPPPVLKGRAAGVDDSGKGVIRYALSDRTFIEKGWTLLPTEKVVRKMNVYRMRPAHPEFDWFERNKNKRLIPYDSGEKFAEFDDNGRSRLYYKNGRLALDYYDAEETNAQQRFVVYSSGEPDERGRSRPVTVLATFDYSGNGVVFDHGGKIRLKYNQTEGVVLDRGIGPVSHWKWHTLNDPPVLQQVMIDTQMAQKDPDIIKLGGSGDNKPRPDNEDMLAIEFDNFIKEKSKKSSQNFKPFQIKMKALKINEQFSLRVLDQATVYLIFREASANLKLNIGMLLDHQEIVDTDTAEVGEVSNSLERLPARSDSLAGLQNSVTFAQRYERLRTERERRLRPQVPTASVDRLTSGTSRPLRRPLLTAPAAASTTSVNCPCKSRKPSTNNLYCETRLI